MPEVREQFIRTIERDINEIPGMRPDIAFIYVSLIPECEFVALSEVTLKIDSLAEHPICLHQDRGGDAYLACGLEEAL